MTNVKDLLADLDRLSADHDRLRAQLHTSLTVEQFMPDAFEHGSCKIGGRSTEHSPETGTVVFTLGNGERREFPAAEVPIELWPDAMRRAYEAKPKHMRKRLQ